MWQEAKKKTRISTRKLDICQPNLSPNITISSSGRVTLRLGEAVMLPLNMASLIKSNSSSLYTMFKLNVNEGLQESLTLNKNLRWTLVEL